MLQSGVDGMMCVAGCIATTAGAGGERGPGAGDAVQRGPATATAPSGGSHADNRPGARHTAATTATTTDSPPRRPAACVPR